MAAPKRRVLIASHGHPAITRGGAENAAYALFLALRDDPGYEAWFLGCRAPPGDGHRGVVIGQPFGEREFVYTLGAFDWFKFANRDREFPGAFRRLLEALRPDVIHFHHFAFFGLEVFWFAKTVLPGVRVVLTAHEYLLMCHAQGQMVTARDQFLCYEASLDACHACFPEHSRGDFFLRRHYASVFLPYLDAVISPSHFLAERLRAWGPELPEIAVIENLALPAASVPVAEVVPGGPLRVGFFGQISRLKGIGVLLEAAKILEARGDSSVAIEIHGTYEGQPAAFQAEFLAQLAEAGPNVRYHGPYRPQQVDALMQGVSVVVVPSIWWENSPMVIREAFRNGRPVICSDIGGMAEKVRDGADGRFFRAGDAASLAALLADLAGDAKYTLQNPEVTCLTIGKSSSFQSHSFIYSDIEMAA